MDKEIQKFYDNYQGANDLRTPEEKELDYVQNEFVAQANEVVWIEKKDKDWRTFPSLNQFYTFKCVAFTTAKIALINFWLKTKEFLKFSPNSIYDYRSNKPQGGMIGDEAFSIWKDKGISLESVCKSEQMQDSDPISVSLFAKEVAKGFKLGNHITIPNGDFDRVASTIQTTGKGVMTWFYFTSREWSSAFPKVMDNVSLGEASRHSVTAVDFGMINGVQYLKIEDSAHFGGLDTRYISREFFNTRNFLIKYPMNFTYEDPQTPPPSTFKFTLLLKLGSNNNEVKELQNYLQKAGFYPNNIATDTVFGTITQKAVKKFQTAHGLLSDGIVGADTRELLNSLV